MSQQREYNCLNFKKCDKRTDEQTNLCIEFSATNNLLLIQKYIFLYHIILKSAILDNIIMKYLGKVDQCIMSRDTQKITDYTFLSQSYFLPSLFV